MAGRIGPLPAACPGTGEVPATIQQLAGPMIRQGRIGRDPGAYVDHSRRPAEEETVSGLRLLVTGWYSARHRGSSNSSSIRPPTGRGHSYW